MEAEELRIGNKVGCKVSNDSGIYTVCAIPKWTHESSQPVTIDRCGYETHPVDKLKPIHLTPEWLERFGFKKLPESYAIGHTDISYHLESRADVGFTDGGYFMGIRYDDWEQDPVTIQKFAYDVKYVHQLQNILFFITGEELIIKE